MIGAALDDTAHAFSWTKSRIVSISRLSSIPFVLETRSFNFIHTEKSTHSKSSSTATKGRRAHEVSLSNICLENSYKYVGLQKFTLLLGKKDKKEEVKKKMGFLQFLSLSKAQNIQAD